MALQAQIYNVVEESGRRHCILDCRGRIGPGGRNLHRSQDDTPILARGPGRVDRGMVRRERHVESIGRKRHECTRITKSEQEKSPGQRRRGRRYQRGSKHSHLSSSPGSTTRRPGRVIFFLRMENRSEITGLALRAASSVVCRVGLCKKNPRREMPSVQSQDGRGAVDCSRRPSIWIGCL